jgi:hypothetical protein
VLEVRPAGFFDEAGIHSQSSIIVVGGYVARDRDWRWLEDRWKTVLKEEGAAFYHTTDIEAEPPRGIYKDWSRAEADHLTDRIVDIGARFKGRAYGVHILASAWYAAVPFVRNFLPERPHDAPYLLLAKDCIEIVINSQPKESTERIALVFAQNDHTHLLSNGYEIVKQISPRPSLLGPLAIDEMANNVMLQAADLISWHYRHANEICKGFIKLPLHRAAPKLIRRNDLFHFVPEGEFKQQVAELFKRHGAEWNERVLAKLEMQDKRRRERKARGESYRRGGVGNGI